MAPSSSGHSVSCLHVTVCASVCTALPAMSAHACVCACMSVLTRGCVCVHHCLHVALCARGWSCACFCGGKTSTPDCCNGCSGAEPGLSSEGLLLCRAGPSRAQLSRAQHGRGLHKNQQNPSTCGEKWGCCPIGGSQGFSRTLGLEMAGQTADTKFFFPLRSQNRDHWELLINPGGFIPCSLHSLMPASNTRCDPTAARSPAPPQTQRLEEEQRAPPGLPTHRGVPGQCTLGLRLWNQEWSRIPCRHAPTAAPIAAGLVSACWNRAGRTDGRR